MSSLLDIEAHEPAQPIELLEHVCAARDWPVERNGDDELIATVAGSWAKHELRAIWREEDGVLQLLAFPDIRVASAQQAAIYETIGLANEQIWLGHFELWTRPGTLVFRHAMPLDGDRDMPLSVDQAEVLVDAAFDECERFYPVFQFVLWGGKSPAEAIAAAMIETQGEA